MSISESDVGFKYYWNSEGMYGQISRALEVQIQQHEN